MTGAGDVLSPFSEAVLGIAGDLALEVVLDRLVGTARELVDAQYAALGIPDEDGTGFDRFITAGMSDEEIEAMGPLPRTHGLLGAMLSDPTPYRSADITEDPRFRGWWPSSHPRMRSFLGVPIVFKDDVIGAFYLTDKTTGPEFTRDDQLVVEALAAHAAVLIEHARLYEESRELSVLDERNRLARELHDAMTQSLFSLRLTLETAAALVESDPPTASGELQRAQALVESLFGELRSLIFELRPPALETEGLAETLRKHLAVVGRAHGIAVAVDVNGSGSLRMGLERELFRIAQEAVTNAVRHAKASSLSVSLDTVSPTVVLAVRDDGVGFDPQARAISSRRLGLTSMRERAQELGGTLTIESRPGSGTTVRAEVPA